MQGIILRGIGGFYTVMDDESGALHTLRAQGKLRKQRLTPTVGDRVRYTPQVGEEHGWVEQILPRRNEMTRPPVSNIDVVVLVCAAAEPEPDLLLIDRLLLSASEHGIPAILAVNKKDLSEDQAASIARQYRGAVDQVILLSAESGEGVDALRRAVLGKVHAFGGQSGVGKSSLINALHGFELQTGVVSEKILRGKHTTRHCELIQVEGGGMVLDTPGFSLLELPLTEPIRLKERYPEFQPHEGQCYFQPCAHRSEPNCAVRSAVAEGEIDEDRYERYCTLFDEMTQRWRERYD